MRILNLTKYRATPEQIADGVIDPTEEQRQTLAELLTFESIPDKWDILEVARLIAVTATVIECKLAKQAGVTPQHVGDFTPYVMIDAPPYLIPDLVAQLTYTMKYLVFYSFAEPSSDRDVLQPKHIGFVPSTV